MPASLQDGLSKLQDLMGAILSCAFIKPAGRLEQPSLADPGWPDQPFQGLGQSVRAGLGIVIFHVLFR